MTMTARLLLVVALLAGWSGVARAAETPEAAVAALYAGYIAEDDTRTTNQRSPQLYSARARALLARLEAACKRKTDDICGPDFDFFVDGQDYKITQFSAKATSAGADKAYVTVRFNNFARPTRLTFGMVRENGRWVIDQITKGGRGGYTLETLFQP